MEKKGNRSSSNSSRTTGTDLKKSIDVSVKQGPRGASRRREPPCGFSKSSETNRKPQPQRNGKTPDKRPKPRGCYYSNTSSRNEETSLEELNEPELGSVFLPGSKKQNINHLLNFSFAPRESNHSFDRTVHENKDGKWLVTRKHKYNKNHFLQANCQFIVNDKGDYKQYLTNPDALVQWDFIEQINVQVEGEPSCPICLYSPVAAKITKCGHIYCWSCMLHYLALSDKEWRKCPICFDAVRKNDLKSVTVIPHKTFTVNDTITFKLMKRLKGNFTVYPADAELLNDRDTIHNWSGSNQENRVSKLFLANDNDILNIIKRENSELQQLMEEDDSCPERCFMEEAKELLNIREINLNGNFDSKNKDDLASRIENGDNQIEVMEGASAASKFQYFYQAEDGQHLYLHAINAEMLKHSYGSLEFGPKTLTGKILEKEGGSMTEELRNKLRYLQHLPITCQFEVAEIKIEEPVISKDTIDAFKNKLEIRKKDRQRRANEERRREKKIEDEENRIIGKYEAPILHLENKFLFPDVKESHLMFPEYTDRRRRTESESTIAQSDFSFPANVTSTSLENTYSGPSFASITREKRSWPALKKPSNQSSATPITLITATERNMSTDVTSVKRTDSDSTKDEFNIASENSVSLGENSGELGEDLDAKKPNQSTSGKKKKNKKKTTLLFVLGPTAYSKS